MQQLFDFMVMEKSYENVNIKRSMSESQKVNWSLLIHCKWIHFLHQVSMMLVFVTYVLSYGLAVSMGSNWFRLISKVSENSCSVVDNMDFHSSYSFSNWSGVINSTCMTVELFSEPNYTILTTNALLQSQAFYMCYLKCTLVHSE